MTDRANYRTTLVEKHHTASQDYDKAVMTLGAGALGISLAFIKDVAGKDPNHTWLLGIAWLLLVLSLVAIFVSFLTSQRAILRQIADLDSSVEQAHRDIYGGLTTTLNWASAVLFIAGVFVLLGFALYNV